MITPLLAPNLEGKPNAVGLTLDDIRACVELGARTLRDPDLQLIDGRTVLTSRKPGPCTPTTCTPGPTATA